MRKRQKRFLINYYKAKTSKVNEMHGEFLRIKKKKVVIRNSDLKQRKIEITSRQSKIPAR